MTLSSSGFGSQVSDKSTLDFLGVGTIGVFRRPDTLRHHRPIACGLFPSPYYKGGCVSRNRLVSKFLINNSRLIHGRYVIPRPIYSSVDHSSSLEQRSLKILVLRSGVSFFSTDTTSLFSVF